MLVVQKASTHRVAPDQRFQYWDQFNASHFVGIRCSSYVPEGLSATLQSLRLDDMTLNLVEGNSHVVERDLTLVKTEPKESVLISIGVGKNAFFYQGKDCEMLNSEYALFYRTDKPYLVGFTDQMRQLSIDIPLQHFQERCQKSLDSPLRIDIQDRSIKLLLRTLYRQINRFMETPIADQASVFQHQTWQLVEALLGLQGSEAGDSSLTLHHQLMARQYMDENLGRADLGVSEVAAALGISPRHLSRLFDAEALSPKQYLLHQRMQQAWSLLTRPRSHRYPIADVACQCGFSSQAHFARTFRQYFDLTPTEARQKGKEAKSRG